MNTQKMESMLDGLRADVSRSATTLNVLTNALESTLTKCAEQGLSAKTACDFATPFGEAFNMVLFELRRIEQELGTQIDSVSCWEGAVSDG